VGKALSFRGAPLPVQELTEQSFAGVEIALFSAGASTSLKFAPAAVKAGAVVVDNSSAYRMDPHIPLVVPEVNPHRIVSTPGIIANPNCSTIQMVVALKPIHDQAKITRVVVSTYQAVSGTGQKAVVELQGQVRDLLAGKDPEIKVYPYQIAYNCLPQIDVFLENDYTKEEMKMVNETKKIMGDDKIKVTSTCVRIPVVGGHSESVNVEFKNDFKIDDIYKILSKTPGIIVSDDPKNNVYPMPADVQGKDEVFVGRIRKDESQGKTLNLWIVSDNLRKGAATNAVQIAEYLLSKGLVSVK
jgi:aspartate-semialdehyde dehydrogenase